MSKGKHEAGRWNTIGDPFAEEKETKKIPKKKKKKRSPGSVAMIALTCVAAAALLAVGVWKSVVKPPDVSDNTLPGGADGMTAHRTETPDETPPSQEQEAPAGSNGRKEEFFTFLLMGKDTSSGSTDTIILVSYDVPNGAVSCMSIPRDTMVNVNWDIKRINSVYSAKESSGGKMPGLRQQVAYLTGVTPDFYVIIEWEAVGELVDALGGVYFDVPYDMNYDDDWQDLHIHQQKGYRLLSGKDAMEVVRWRKNNDGTNYGDTTRVQVQQAFLKAVASQCLQLKNVTKVKDFAQIFFNNVETDLPLNNLLWFAQKAMGVSADNIRFMTLPGNYGGWAWSRTYHNNQSYVFAYPDEVVEMVNTYFNPYLRDVTEEDLQIMFRNKDGSIGITNGTVLDTKAASAPVKPATKTEKTEQTPPQQEPDPPQTEPEPPQTEPEPPQTEPEPPQTEPELPPEEPELPPEEDSTLTQGETTDETGSENTDETTDENIDDTPSDTEKPGWL